MFKVVTHIPGPQIFANPYQSLNFLSKLEQVTITQSNNASVLIFNVKT